MSLDRSLLASDVALAVATSETWADLRERLDHLAGGVEQQDTGGLTGWQPTRIAVDWLPRVLTEDAKVALIDGATRAIRRAETTEAAIRSVLRIAIRAARLAGAA